MAKLAINGGPKVREKLFPAQNTITNLEKNAVMRVMDGHAILTGYQGNWGPNFRGGVEVRALEEEWAAKFGVKHAIACNSATSGLYIACGAVGMADGGGNPDAIVTPFSMTCSASIPLAWNHGVKFADIERDYYCLDPMSVRELLYDGERQKSAVIAVSLFGQPFDPEIVRLAHDRGVKVIEDAAQAIGAMYCGRHAGTLGDIGVYSFNLGKHLTAGEGGMLVTNDDDLAIRCRLIMNHAEAVVNDMSRSEPAMTKRYRHLFGQNLRMSEIHAAIIRVQLSKMDELISKRVENVKYLVDRLKDIPCLEMPKVRPGATHTYYVLPLKYKPSATWVSEKDMVYRDKFVAAVKAELPAVAGRESEGVTIGCGYIKPIQSMPLFGLSMDETPECRRQYEDELIILHRFFGPMACRQDLDDVAAAFQKVWENREELL